MYNINAEASALEPEKLFPKLFIQYWWPSFPIKILNNLHTLCNYIDTEQLYILSRVQKDAICQYHQ